jgi:hypothetical protein
MTRDYKTMAKHVVTMDGSGDALDLVEVEKMLRVRTAAMSEERIVEKYGRGVTKPFWQTLFNR